MSLPSELVLESLPNETLSQILRSIPELPDLLSACATSRTLRSICQNESFWRERFQQDFGYLEKPEDGGRWKNLYYQIWENIRSPPPFSIGSNHAGIIDSDGYLHTRGSNEFGTLGIGDERSINTSAKIKIGGENKRVIQVSCGYAMTAAIDEDGEVWTWGLNANGSLGIGLQEEDEINSPIKAIQPDGQVATKVVVGTCNMIVMTQTGDVYVWGKLMENLRSSIPIKLKLPEKAIDVACGDKSFAAVGENGELYFWGDSRYYLFLSPNWHKNLRGEFNPQDLSYLEFTEPIIVETEEPVRQISMGYSHFGIVTRTGKVWMAGNNNMFQLGKMETSSQEKDDNLILGIRLIPLPGPVHYLDCRWHTTLARGSSKIWIWGDNRFGQITSESYKISVRQRGSLVIPTLGKFPEKFSKPQEIQLFDPTGKRQVIRYISVGGQFSMAVTEDGYINIWGKYYY